MFLEAVESAAMREALDNRVLPGPWGSNDLSHVTVIVETAGRRDRSYNKLLHFGSKSYL